VHTATTQIDLRGTSKIKERKKITLFYRTSLCTARKRALDVSRTLSSMEENVLSATPKVELIIS